MSGTSRVIDVKKGNCVKLWSKKFDNTIMFQFTIEGNLGNSGGIVNVKKHVKVEGSVLSWVESMHGTPLNIIFDKKNPLLQIEFSNKYGLSTKDYHQTFEVQEGL